MADKKCPKCGSDMDFRGSYSVCSECGELVPVAEGEEITTVAEETIAEKETDLFATQIPEEHSVEEEAAYEEIQEESVQEETGEERSEETFYVVPEKKKKAKGKKKSAASVFVIILCAMLAVGGYYVVKDMSSGGVDVNEIESEGDDMPSVISSQQSEDEVIGEEVPVFEEPVAKPVESLEPLDEDEEELATEPEKEPEQNEEPEEEPQDTPATQPAQKPAQKPVVKPDKKPAASVQTPEEEKPAAPAVAYRVRKSANDSKTQIGAFADLERAKRFAIGNASDGYKVFDMNGNLVFAP